MLKFVRSFAPIISWWKCCLRGSYGRESCEVCCKVILDLWMCRFPYENYEFDIFRNNYHEKYENQDINSPGDRFRWNFVRTSITSFQAYLVQWWSKSDRQIFHTFDMKIFDNFIFKTVVIRSNNYHEFRFLKNRPTVFQWNLVRLFIAPVERVWATFIESG